MKTILSILVVLVIIAAGGYFLFFAPEGDGDSAQNETGDDSVVVDDVENGDEGEGQETTENEPKMQSVIGTSVEGRPITAYHFGTGESDVLLVGGVHGGYSWNTALVAFEAIDYLGENPDKIPANVRVTVVPVLNPDGLNKTLGTAGRFAKGDVPKDQAQRTAGRFNANTVDLNRNFDCDWQKNAKWQDKNVSGGESAFSEPESRAVKSYIEKSAPSAVVVWYSAAGGVFASNCHNGVLPETTEITNVFSDASGYRAYEEFNFYEITGDMVNWLAGEDIPAISVLLTTHEDIEWDKNRAGIDALLAHYAQ
jgi:hypothetical protein